MQILAEGTATSPRGFQAAAFACGFKRSGATDLALLVSDSESSGAGVFTRNQLPAAPVVLDRETLSSNSGRLRAVITNSGSANACTGMAGLEDAKEMQRLTAKDLHCDPDQVLVLSTGLIGLRLDMVKLEAGIHETSAALSVDHGAAAAEAIMTTDTRVKQTAVTVELPQGTVTIGGMAKGSGMIHPDMATTLAVLTSDAQVPPAILQKMLGHAVDHSFNRITVDGDTSTNDSVLVLANGASGVRIEDDIELERFGEALDRVCYMLAQQVVHDGEGASRFLTLTVGGAPDEKAALQVARVIATSPLVKTALGGADPNWGRVLAAAGRAGVELDPDRLALWIRNGSASEVQLVDAGQAAEWDEAHVATIMAATEVQMRLELGLGEGSATVWTCDLTEDYVSINTRYRT